MTVSINILNYNTYEKSCICIDSCLKQKGIDFQILLIDNASTDDSFEKLKLKYGDAIHYLQTGKNYGFAGGNNKGVEYCLQNNIRYAFLLNSDTELIGITLLSELINIIKNYPDCAIVSPTIYDITKSGYIIHTNDYLYNKLLRLIGILPSIYSISDNIKLTSEAHGSALLVDCKRFISAGGFPEHYFMYCEESTLSKKMLWNDTKIYWYINKQICVYHHHDKTQTIAPWREFLMGRNRAIEYYENKRSHSKLWYFVYRFFQFKMFFRSLKTNNTHFYHGMKEGEKLIKHNSSHLDIYLNGLKMSQTYMQNQ